MGNIPVFALNKRHSDLEILNFFFSDISDLKIKGVPEYLCKCRTLLFSGHMNLLSSLTAAF